MPDTPSVLTKDQFDQVRSFVIQNAPPGLSKDDFNKKIDETAGYFLKNKKLPDTKGLVGSAASKAQRITGPRTWGESIRENLPTVGMTIGSLATENPAGAAIGGAVGEAGRQAIRRYQGLDTNKSLGSRAGDIALEAGIGAVSEVGGRKLIAAPARRLLGGWYREGASTAEGAAARQAAETYKLPTTAPEIAGATGSLPLGLSRAGFTPFARNVSIEAQKQASEKLAGAVQTEIGKLTGTILRPGGVPLAPELAGTVTKTGMELAQEVSGAHEAQLYAAVDNLYPKKATVQVVSQVPGKILDARGIPIPQSVTTSQQQMVGGASVSTTALKDYAKDVDLEIGKVKDVVRKLGGDKSVLSLTDALKDIPDRVNFREASTLRSQLLKAVRSIKDMLPDKYAGIQKQLTSIIDRSMEDGAKALDPDAYNAWRAANRFTRARHDLFDRSVVKDVMGEHPELVFDQLGSKNVTDARAIMRAFDDYMQIADPKAKVALQHTKNVFRQAYVSRMLANPDKPIAESLKEYAPVLKVLMGDAKGKAVMEGLSRLAAFQSRQQPVKGFSHWLLYETIGHATGLTLGYASGSGYVTGGALAATEAAPWVLAKILYNPTATRFLLDGVAQLPKGSEAAGPAMMRAVRVALTAGDPHEEPDQPSGTGPTVGGGPGTQEKRP